MQGDPADGDLVAVVQPARRFERPAGDAVLAAVFGEAVDPEAVLLVRPLDLDAKLFRKDAGAAAMVDVAVGEPDLLDRDPGLRRRCLEPRQVAAGIDERAAHGFRAPQQGAVLLERRDGKDRRAERRVAHLPVSTSDSAGCTSFIDAATASACRMARSTLPPASLARFSSLQPRRINSAKTKG